MIGTAGSAEKCAFVRARGAAHAIDYQAENVVERVLALTGGRGADIVFDHVAGKAFADGLKMVAPLGMIVSYAVLGGMPETDLFEAMRANIEKSPAVRCFTMHTYDHMEEPRREAMARAVELLGSGQVKPAIAARIPLAEAPPRARTDRSAPRDGQDRAEAVELRLASGRRSARTRACRLAGPVSSRDARPAAHAPAMPRRSRSALTTLPHSADGCRPAGGA